MTIGVMTSSMTHDYWGDETSQVMARLFSEFFRLGGVVIATSNRAPQNLYENGLQRSLFLPFIKTLARQVVVHDMDSYVK